VCHVRIAVFTAPLDSNSSASPRCVGGGLGWLDSDRHFPGGNLIHYRKATSAKLKAANADIRAEKAVNIAAKALHRRLRAITSEPSTTATDQAVKPQLATGESRLSRLRTSRLPGALCTRLRFDVWVGLQPMCNSRSHERRVCHA
jgi:hypothetical protein